MVNGKKDSGSVSDNESSYVASTHVVFGCVRHNDAGSGGQISPRLLVPVRPLLLGEVGLAQGVRAHRQHALHEGAIGAHLRHDTEHAHGLANIERTFSEAHMARVTHSVATCYVLGTGIY